VRERRDVAELSGKKEKSGAGRRPFELINYFWHGISLTSTPASCAVDALFHQNIFLAALGSSLGSWLAALSCTIELC
jgi:hypothetical protein